MCIKKRYIIVFIVFVVLIVCFVIHSVSEKNINTIKDYEIVTLSTFTSNEVLDDIDDRNLYLNQMEQYLVKNKKKLFIKDIDRLEDSITIKFVFGNRYMIYPLVKNMK